MGFRVGEIKRILVVEDDHNIRVTLRSALEAEGYFVFSAANGLDGLALLRQIKPPSLVLLDQTLPIMDGKEFLAVKCRDPRIAMIPVIVFSGIENQSRSPDVVEFVPKPFQLEALLKLVKKYVDREVSQDENESVSSPERD